jgi:hypothetical protein
MKRFLHILLLLLIALGGDAQTLTLRDPAFVARLNTASSSGTLLLDETGLAANCVKACSETRRLTINWTGALIRVRRSSDSAERDIPYSGANILDTADMFGWSGSDSVYIVTCYDQTGNGNHNTQTTTSLQPMLVNAGVLQTKNGKPAGLYDGSGDYYTGPGYTFGDHTWLTVQQSTGDVYLSGTDGVNRQVRMGTSGSDVLSIFYGSSVTSSTLASTRANLSLVGFTRTGSAGEFWYNATSRGTYSNNTTILLNTCGKAGSTANFNGYMPEVIRWSVDLGTTLRQRAEANINSFYALY